jgi:hypothetical protein
LSSPSSAPSNASCIAECAAYITRLACALQAPASPAILGSAAKHTTARPRASSSSLELTIAAHAFSSAAACGRSAPGCHLAHVVANSNPSRVPCVIIRTIPLDAVAIAFEHSFLTPGTSASPPARVSVSRSASLAARVAPLAPPR